MNKRIIYAHSTRQQIMSWYVADIVADNQITDHKKRKKGIFRLCFSLPFFISKSTATEIMHMFDIRSFEILSFIALIKDHKL